MPEPRYSVIIPTLNEEKSIQAAIRSVRKQRIEVEIIIADAGSTDRTTTLAQGENTLVTTGAKGRGTQCNAGAFKATGDILIFLHADTTLPDNAFKLIAHTFSNPDVQIGRFRLQFDSSHLLMRLFAGFSRFDSMLTSFGDQCIIIRKSFFEEIGGFPDWPLFEDVHLFRLARRQTKIHSLPAKVITSERRFLKHGIARCQFFNGWLIVQYLLGTAPERLGRYYESDYFFNKSLFQLIRGIFSGMFVIFKRGLRPSLNTPLNPSRIKGKQVPAKKRKLGEYEIH